MKKNFRNIVFLLMVFVVFLGLAPRFFLLDDIRKTIAAQVSTALHSTVTIARMHWAWLPLPHLVLNNTHIANAHYDLSLPTAKIFPSWRILLGDIRQPGKILLDRPEMHIHKTAFQPGGSPAPLLPGITIIIRNGSLAVESPEEYRDVLVADSLTFGFINGKLKLLPQEIAVDFRASSPFSKSISLEGSFNIPESKYLLSVDCREIDLHKSIKAFFQGRLIPVASTASLAGTVTGTGLQHIKGDLYGTLPAFAVKHQEREIVLTGGSANLRLLKSGPLLRLDINNFEVKDPGANLSGHIERTFSLESGPDQPPAAEPVWTLDITGSDLDLTGIRQRILGLWGDNKVAKAVSAIVLGGKARSAVYRFSGSAADFKNLNAMVIEADVLNAAIHVPGAKLDLTEASGPIEIRNSIVTGRGLSARLGKSYGRHAELLLDIGKHGETFRLDIDIDADLEDLPPILARLVHHEGFQRELSKFTEVSGKAAATVHLGDSLKKIITRVDVKNMQVETRYERIPQTIFIDSGALHLEPGIVDWLQVKGRIGRQEISSVSGNVSWQTGDPMLHIAEMQAQLEGASLYGVLQQTEIMPRKINNVLSSLNGTINLTGGSLEGPPLKPESWQYEFALATTGLTLTSPLLPAPASTEKLTAVINHNGAEIHEAEIQFLAQSFNLKAVLQHHLLGNWYGIIEYNGPVQTELANWITSKGWFPDKLRPQIPCTMENLKVNWHGKTVAATGIILHGIAGDRLPMARIDFTNTPERLRLNELTFYAPGEQGRLELEFQRRSPQSLTLSWEGFVRTATIDALFQHSLFAAGTLSGAFKVSSFADRPGATRFDGLLQAENLLLKTEMREHPVIITDLHLIGSGSHLQIPVLSLAIGTEKITGSGQIAAEKDGIQLDMSLASPFLAKESLANLSLAIQEAQNTILHVDSEQESKLQMARDWEITGRIGFDFDSFTFNRTTITPYDEEHAVTYNFSEMHGDLQLAPGRISRTEIFAAKLCGLDFKGSWFSDADLGQKFALNTDPDETFRLENVLPCLGVQQDIIEGEFTLQADLLKESNSWYGGNIYIKSSQGRILRLKTLSRIFSVVNITDLFEKHVENAGKRGFPYSRMDIDTHIHANNLVVDRAIIRGEGLNLFARGEIHLDDYDADLTLLIAPFKTFDTIVSKVPIIGQPLMGESGSRMSIPVAVKGPIADPVITPMHPEAVGDAVLNLIKDTFMLPYNILKPLENLEINSGSGDTNRK